MSDTAPGCALFPGDRDVLEINSLLTQWPPRADVRGSRHPILGYKVVRVQKRGVTPAEFFQDVWALLTLSIPVKCVILNESRKIWDWRQYPSSQTDSPTFNPFEVCPELMESLQKGTKCCTNTCQVVGVQFVGEGIAVRDALIAYLLGQADLRSAYGGSEHFLWELQGWHSLPSPDDLRPCTKGLHFFLGEAKKARSGAAFYALKHAVVPPSEWQSMPMITLRLHKPRNEVVQLFLQSRPLADIPPLHELRDFIHLVDLHHETADPQQMLRSGLFENEWLDVSPVPGPNAGEMVLQYPMDPRFPATGVKASSLGECPICLDKFAPDQILVTHRGHCAGRFHSACLSELISQASPQLHSWTCPICRKNFSELDFQALIANVVAPLLEEDEKKIK